MGRRAGGLALSLFLIVTALAGATTVQSGNLRITVLSQLQPYKLPRSRPAPVAVFVAGHLESANGQTPPQLREMRIKVNRHGLLRSKGLPTCHIRQVQPASTERALANCGDALVGSGQFWAHIILPDQEPYPTRGRLLVFNGRRKGRPVLLAQIYTANPFNSSFVIVFAIRHIDQGAYGTELTASLPQALGSWGYLDRIKLTLRREYSYRGKRRSFFNAACPAPVGTTRAAFDLAYADLYFDSARRKLPLRELTVKANPSPLIAKVGGGQLKLATSPALDSRRLGFGVELTARRLALSAKLATRLNKKLRPAEPFQAGQQLGRLTAKAQPLTATLLPSGSAALAFAPAFLAKLDSLHVSINPVFPAEHLGAPFSFPVIAGSAISPDASTGTLRTGGDLEFLQLGGGQVFWHEQWLDLGARSDSAEASIQPSPPYAGKLGRTPIAALTLAGPAVADPAKRTIAVEGASLTLDSVIATTFNDVFAKPQGKAGAFLAGEAMGTVSFTAQGQ